MSELISLSYYYRDPDELVSVTTAHGLKYEASPLGGLQPKLFFAADECNHYPDSYYFIFKHWYPRKKSTCDVRLDLLVWTLFNNFTRVNLENNTF